MVMLHAKTDQLAFPQLDDHEIELVEAIATRQVCGDGEIVFRAGDADIDLVIIKSGQLDILNPTEDGRVIVSHEAGEFAGDIDLITRRPVIVTAVARGPRTELLRVPGSKIRALLNTIPRLGEKLITAFTARRKMLEAHGLLGMKIIGPKCCRDTTVVREFLYKNFVPFTW